MYTHADQLDTQALWRVLDVTRQLGAPVDLETTLHTVIEAAREVLGADRGTVFLYDKKTNELFAKVATGLKEIRFPAKVGIAGECAQTRKVLNIPDVYADARFNQEVDRKTGYRTRCLLTIPLVGIDNELVGVMQLLNKTDGVFEEDDERLGTALAAQCAVALQRAKLLEDFMVKQKLERDLALAHDIQQRVLPTSMPVLSGYDLAGWSRPADETGGDIYDVVGVDDSGALLLLCDATGHGIGPALSVTQVRSMFRMAMRLKAPLDDMFVNVNDQLCDDLAENRFVTAFAGLLDTNAHKVEYHAGGQGPIIHLHAATGDADLLEASTIPMGIMPGLIAGRPDPIRLAPGDILALISDGIFEYIGPGNEQFGEQRVLEVLRAHQDKPMHELIRLLVEAVMVFACGMKQNDDMTVVLVKRHA